MPRAFRKQGRFWFLTYSQSSFDIDDYIAHTRTLLQAHLLRGGIVASETHQDGGHHRHVALHLDQTLVVTDSRFFDYAGRHPNLQVARNWKRVLSYVKKDGEWHGFGQYAEVDSAESAEYTEKGVELFNRAETASCQKEFVKYCFANDVPIGYCTLAWSIARTTTPPVYLEETPVGGTIELPYLRYLGFNETCRRAMVLLGPTGVGKTVWALKNAPKPALLVTHMDDLRHLDNTIKSIVFDDMSFVHMPRESQIHLVDFDLDRSIHCRYSVARIPAGTFKIFTCNQMCFLDDPAIRRRLHIVDLFNLDN